MLNHVFEKNTANISQHQETSTSKTQNLHSQSIRQRRPSQPSIILEQRPSSFAIQESKGRIIRSLASFLFFALVCLATAQTLPPTLQPQPYSSLQHATAAAQNNAPSVQTTRAATRLIRTSPQLLQTSALLMPARRLRRVQRWRSSCIWALRRLRSRREPARRRRRRKLGARDVNLAPLCLVSAAMEDNELAAKSAMAAASASTRGCGITASNAVAQESARTGAARATARNVRAAAFASTGSRSVSVGNAW
jgi:hypothetical protein